MKKAVIVIPTYNEAGNIETLINKTFDQAGNINDWQIEILVVDSSSPDKTANVVKDLQKKYKNLYLLETQKEGLGKAYVSGFLYALNKLSPDVFFEMDADLSHDPALIPDFLEHIDKGSDFVIGSRYIKGGSIPQDWALHRKIFSVLGNLICRFGFMKLKISDWTSGYRAIKSSIVKETASHVEKYSGYVFQIALLDQATKKNAKISEVAINFIDRQYGVSKINAAQFILNTLWYIFSHSSFIRYAIVGLGGASLDFGLSFILIEIYRINQNLYWLATAISAETAIIFNFLMNNFWSFSHKKLRRHFGTIFSSFLKFNLIAIGALAIQAVGIQLLTNFYGPSLWYVYKILILALIVIPYSYILYNKIVWK